MKKKLSRMVPILIGAMAISASVALQYESMKTGVVPQAPSVLGVQIPMIDGLFWIGVSLAGFQFRRQIGNGIKWALRIKSEVKP